MKVILYFQTSQKTSAPSKLAGVVEIATRANVHVQVIEQEPTARRIAELVAFWNPIGAIVDCGGAYADIDTSVFGKLPTVLVGHNPDTLPAGSISIRHDSAETARTAARELMMTGFKDFAFIPSRERRYWSDIRQHAFTEAVALNGFACHSFRHAARKESQMAWQAALRRHLRALTRPCAVFAANDTTAAEVLTAARFEGISVPDELAVIGVDNYEQLCEQTVPPLTSIEPDFRRGGNLAAQTLLAVVQAGNDYKGDRNLSFGPLRIVRRESSRSLFVPDRIVGEALNLIRREACSGLQAARVAALFGCSRRFADIRFKKATGNTILEEIHTVRLERAKQLLANPYVQLKSISDSCGFTHPNSLRKFFLRETGMTMRAWRKKQC